MRGRIGRWLHLLAVALQFCTRLPLGRLRVDDGDLRAAAAVFPLAGVVVAAVGVAARVLAQPLWGPVVATVVAVAAMVALTGALHEDGLADTADGLWAALTPEGRLEVMRDSRIGTYGVLALATVVGLRVALLAPLDLAGFVRATLAAHVLGRAAVPALARWLPAAGPGSAGLVTGAGGWGLAFAAATAVVAAALAAGPAAPLLLGAGGLAVAVCGLAFRRRLGGTTGDAFGAAVVVTELTTLAAVVALLR